MQSHFICRAVLVAALLAGGCNDQRDTPAGAGTPGSNPKDLSQDPDFRMTAAEYFADWQANEEAARKKFSWKVIELTGTAVSFQKDGPDSFIELAVPGQTRFVRCSTTDPRPWNRVSAGQAVRIRGQFVGGGDPVVLYRCTVVEATGPKSPALTADRLGAELDADPAAAAAKYKGTRLVVTGTVDRVERAGKYQTRLYFRTDSTSRVYAEVSPLRPDWTEKIRPGDKVRVLVSFSPGPTKKDLALGFAVDAGPED
jgi:hypothetical protein